jgi:hypothetical protein
LDCSEAFDDSVQVSLTPVPAAGFRFIGWTGACSGSGACTVTMNADKTVGATFAPDVFTLTITVTGLGAVDATAANEAPFSCSLACARSYPRGTTVTLAATPAAGQVFTGWSGDCTGTAPCMLPIDGDRVVTATFA